MKIKTTLQFIVTVFALSLTAAVLHAGESSRSAVTAPYEVREEFGHFLGSDYLQYSNTLGLALWHNAKLYEGHIKVDPSRSDIEKKIDDQIKNRAPGGIIITDYSKLGLDTTLEFEKNEGSALLLRVRKKFQFYNEDSEGATYMYADDRKLDDSGSRVEAAVMLDWYLDPLYNKPLASPIGWIDRPFRFWFRTGYEINKNDLPGKQEVDQQKWYGLLNFQANPDQNAHFLGLPGLDITSPQIIQLGAVFEQNNITGQEDWHWIAGWSPVFKPHGDYGPFKGFGLNKRMYFGESKAKEAPSVETKTVDVMKAGGKEAAKVVIVKDQDPRDGWRWYGSINPSVNVLGQDDARGVLNELKKTRSLKDLEKLQDEQVTWKVEGLLGVKDGLFELSYSATGSHPISDLSHGRIGQEIRADLDVAKLAVALSHAPTPGPKDWQTMKAYVSYRRGQFEPTFEDIDLVTAGVSVRF